MNLEKASAVVRIEVLKTSADLKEEIPDMFISEGLRQLSGIKNITVSSKGEITSVEAVIYFLSTGMGVVTSTKGITVASIWSAADKLNQNSILFKDTGVTHIAGIFNEGNAVFTEDISRHCALDKIVGLALHEKIDLSQAVLLTSCRLTASTIVKAVHSIILIVTSTSAVISFAIECANIYDITLIGFAKQRRFNVYFHRERITEND